MHLSSRFARPVSAALAAAILIVALAPTAPSVEPGPVKVRASETSHAVDGTRDFAISSSATHVGVHWAGQPNATVRVSLSTDGRTFSNPEALEVDADGQDGGESYGDLIGVDGVSVVRVLTDRPLARVTVLALDASGPDPLPLGLGAQADGLTNMPGVISRRAWGADETLRFDPAGDEQWPREYFPLQKLVIHHTAGANNDPNPAATVRAIYYYHAVTQRWGDIGYAYLIDEAGRIYEGRYARDFWNGATPTSDNPAGGAVEGGHAKYQNPGTMGIGMLGTFSTRAPTAAARASLVKLLAWAAAKYHIDPMGSGTYVNPVTGLARNRPNIGGHRDYSATSCPGTVLYAMIPQIRKDVAAQINSWAGEIFNPPRTLTFAAGTHVGRWFSPTGVVTSTRTYTLTHTSAAPTTQRATIPNQAGSWFLISGGVWAGTWIPASPAVTLGAAPGTPVSETFATVRPLGIPAGPHVGRRFDSYGNVIASKSFTLASGSTTWTTQHSTIPRQSGDWYYVTAGIWDGYWFPAGGTSLGPPPPPLPAPIAIYNPPRNLWFQPGTYTGRRFSAYGIPAGTVTYTISKLSAAPTSRYSTLPGQSGRWFYIINGLFESYWIRETSATTLGGIAPADQPPNP
jgi:hypothetical protein